jgi:hypothetical protein
MSPGKTLAKVLIFAILNFGALAGVPMDPEKIRQLMELTNRTRVEHVVKKQDPP